MQWFNIGSGQAAVSRYVSSGQEQGQSLATDWICYITCNPVVQGLWGALWGIFDGLWHPLSFLSHECPVDLVCGTGCSAGPVCEREDGCSLPLTKGHTWNLLALSFNSGRWVCVNLASVGCGSHPKSSQRWQHGSWVWFSSGYLSPSLVCFFLGLVIEERFSIYPISSLTSSPNF